MRKKLFYVAIIVCLAVLVLTIPASVFAIWEQKTENEQAVEVPTEQFNPSLKHIIFYGLDNTDAETALFTEVESEIEAYAVVGYTGLVQEVIIPESYNSKPVIKISGHKDYSDEAIRKNDLIMSLTIPGSVTRIMNGACSDMKSLETVIFLGTSDDNPIYIEDFAFMSCKILTDFRVKDSRILQGNESRYLYDTGVAK